MSRLSRYIAWFALVFFFALTIIASLLLAQLSAARPSAAPITAPLNITNLFNLK